MQGLTSTGTQESHSALGHMPVFSTLSNDFFLCLLPFLSSAYVPANTTKKSWCVVSIVPSPRNKTRDGTVFLCHILTSFCDVGVWNTTFNWQAITNIKCVPDGDGDSGGNYSRADRLTGESKRHQAWGPSSIPTSTQSHKHIPYSK